MSAEEFLSHEPAAQRVGLGILWHHAYDLPEDPANRMLRGIVAAVVQYADESGIEITSRAAA